MSDTKNSLAARIAHSLDSPPALPSSTELSEPDQLGQLVQRARSMRRGADATSRRSLHHELTMCYHAALFIITNDGAWENLVKGRNRLVPKPRSDLKVLQAVLLEYTGDDLDGMKKASRFKRALEDPFVKKTPPLEVFAKLKNEGGVDGLLRSRSPKEQWPRRKTLKSVTISDPGLRKFPLPSNARQALILMTEDEGALYEVRISKNVAGSRIVRNRITPSSKPQTRTRSLKTR